MPVVDIKGVGKAQFPDEMPVNDIKTFLRNKYFQDVAQGNSRALEPQPQTAANVNPSLIETAGQKVSDYLFDQGIVTDRYGAQEAGKGIVGISEFLEVIGSATAGDDFGKAAAQGDILGMGVGLLGAVPVLGDVAKGIGKKITKYKGNYPLDDFDSWWGDRTYKEQGGSMFEMSPDEYLSQVKPLKMDEETLENIDDLVDHMQSGRKLDPLVIYADGKEDGRHRALAAKKLGLGTVPVIDYRGGNNGTSLSTNNTNNSVDDLITRNQVKGDINEQITSTTTNERWRDAGRIRGTVGLLDEQGRQVKELGRGASGELNGLPKARGYNPKPNTSIQSIAKKYVESVGGVYTPSTQYAKINTNNSTAIADEFDRMVHNPKDPETLKAYNQMIEETVEQYKAVMDSGLKVEFVDFAKTGDPYADSPRLAIEDIEKNNHMYVFSTKDGFGSDAEFDPTENPLLAETDFEISGQKALANDLFRVVHDYFGHAKEGVGFRASGEENAWRQHSSMYTPLARRAMTTETRGQNSWVNYGKFGDKNRTAMTGETVFADQKIGLLPEWVSNGEPQK